MKKRNTSIVVIDSILAGVLVLGAAAVSAHDEGEVIFRTGIASVQPDSSSSSLVLNNGAIANSAAGVKSDGSLGLTATYMLSNHWGLGVLAASPFEHDITADTGALNLGVVTAGSTKHLPPTISVQYFPMDSSSAFQPYIGVGVNYTNFFSENVSSTLEGVIGASGTLTLDDSFGLAAEIGVDYQINEKWFINGCLWYADIDTDATFNFANGSTLTTNVSIDPKVYMLSLGYKF